MIHCGMAAGDGVEKWSAGSNIIEHDLPGGAPVHAMAHVTGGGLTGNLPRVLPRGCRAVIRRDAWPVPPVFGLIQAGGRVTDAEMRRVFNMGVGFVCVVAKEGAPAALRRLDRAGVPAWAIGEIRRGPRGVAYV